MARYRMGTDRMVDTDLAQQSWPDSTKWDGKQHIGRTTGSPWERETLYLSAMGNYYIVKTGQAGADAAEARFIEPTEALLWLHTMGHTPPDDLQGLSSLVIE